MAARSRGDRVSGLELRPVARRPAARRSVCRSTAVQGSHRINTGCVSGHGCDSELRPPFARRRRRICWGTRTQGSVRTPAYTPPAPRSEEHTSELQSHLNLVCRLLLEKKKKNTQRVSGCISQRG